MRRVRRLTAVEEVVAVAEAAVAEAEDMGAVAASAPVPWVASAEVTRVALAEVAWPATPEVAWLAWAKIAMAMEDVVSAALMTTAAVRITRHTTGPTTAPTEW